MHILCFILLLTVFVQLWGVGVIDFAGSSVVHLTGGSTALIATYLLGPRRGRFHDHRGQPLQTPKEFPGHSPALQMLGGKHQTPIALCDNLISSSSHHRISYEICF